MSSTVNFRMHEDERGCSSPSFICVTSIRASLATDTSSREKNQHSEKISSLPRKTQTGPNYVSPLEIQE